MRLVCISDTHNQHDRLRLPEGDVLIHAGDATNMGTVREIHDFFLWWEKQKFPHKLFTAGNHDELYEVNPGLVNTLIHNFHEEQKVIDGVKFYGASWTPRFGSYSFNLSRGPDHIGKKWEHIPTDVNVLITHGPPQGILDANGQDIKCGCEELLKAVQRIEPEIHIFGHIHQGYGVLKRGNTTFINASMAGAGRIEGSLLYRPINNEPIVIDI
jgi:Icc-related predicted phosphoesterase